MSYFPIQHYKVLKSVFFLSRKEQKRLKSDQFICGLIIQSILPWNQRAALSAYAEAFLLTAKNRIQDEKELRRAYYESIINWFTENEPGESKKYRLTDRQFSSVEVAQALQVVGEKISKGSEDLRLYFSTSPPVVGQELEAEIKAIEIEFLPEKSLPHTIYMQVVLFNFLVCEKKKSIWIYRLQIIKSFLGIPLKISSDDQVKTNCNNF